MRKMRLFYEAWMPRFEIHSAVPNEITLIGETTNIQPFTFRSTVSTEIKEVKEEDLKAFISVAAKIMQK